MEAFIRFLCCVLCCRACCIACVAPWVRSLLACSPCAGHPRPTPRLPLPAQIMHVLVAAAMWQLHLGAAADYRTVSALLDGSMQCPS